MCDPLTIAGAAATVGGMVLNQRAESAANKARTGAMAAENMRQSRLQQEAEAINNASRDRYDDFKGQEEEKGASLAEFFKGQNSADQGGSKMVPVGAPAEAPVGGGNNIVVQERAKQLGKAKAFGDQQATAQGVMRGFGDLLADRSRLQARDAAQVGQIGGFMRGSAGILPLELEAANRKGTRTAMFGDILSGLGRVGMTAGLSAGTLATPAAASAAEAGVPAGALSWNTGAGPLPWLKSNALPWGAV